MSQKDSSGLWRTVGSARDVCTSSGLRAWWLSTVRGYRVRSIVQMPRRGSFGRIRYYRRWVLAPRDEAPE